MTSVGPLRYWMTVRKSAHTSLASTWGRSQTIGTESPHCAAQEAKKLQSSSVAASQSQAQGPFKALGSFGLLGTKSQASPNWCGLSQGFAWVTIFPGSLRPCRYKVSCLSGERYVSNGWKNTLIFVLYAAFNIVLSVMNWFITSGCNRASSPLRLIVVVMVHVLSPWF